MKIADFHAKIDQSQPPKDCAKEVQRNKNIDYSVQLERGSAPCIQISAKKFNGMCFELAATVDRKAY
jgi:hypothetical protein